MEKITYATNISKSGNRVYVNIPDGYHDSLESMMGKQVKVTIEDIS